MGHEQSSLGAAHVERMGGARECRKSSRRSKKRWLRKSHHVEENKKQGVEEESEEKTSGQLVQLVALLL